jgi:hypothetical protein
MNYLSKRKCIFLNMKDFVNNFDLLNYEKNFLEGIQCNLFSDAHFFKSFSLCRKFKLKLYVEHKTKYFDFQETVLKGNRINEI